MLTDTDRSAAPFSLIVLALVIFFGAVQLFFWTDRSIWIDEISQLLNFPLDSLTQAFGPLPVAQQAGPPLFNLLLHNISGLTINTMRIIMVGITLGVILAALIGAFGRRPLPIAAGLFVLLSHQSFLINASMLKFYAFDIAGFSIFAAWIYAKNRDDAFNLRDVAIVLTGMVLGVSTIVGACVVVAVFLTPRLAHRQIGVSEIAFGALVAVIALGYYIQISNAVEIQITGFPDTYGRLGVEAVLKFFEAASELFQRKGLATLLVLFTVTLAAIILLSPAERSGLGGLALFTAVISFVFLGLAAIGKYPAVSSRHLVWMLGIYPVLVGAVIQCLLLSKTNARRPFAIGGLILLTFVFAGTGLRVVMKWPPQIVEGASDKLVSTLADLPPSDVLNYFGSIRLIPLMIERGAPIQQHTYAPTLSTNSGAIDSAYLGTDWNNLDEDLFSQRIEAMLRDDPLGWAKMYVISRVRGDFRPLARFVLDAAPTDDRTFYISSIHASWPGLPGRATSGLRAVLDERFCEYLTLAIFDTLLSPGYVLQVKCPQPG
jgi:hypothetical protein